MLFCFEAVLDGMGQSLAGQARSAMPDQALPSQSWPGHSLPTPGQVKFLLVTFLESLLNCSQTPINLEFSDCRPFSPFHPYWSMCMFGYPCFDRLPASDMYGFSACVI